MNKNFVEEENGVDGKNATYHKMYGSSMGSEWKKNRWAIEKENVFITGIFDSNGK